MALDISTLDPAKTVVVATGNPHKVTEIEAILAQSLPGVRFVALGELGSFPDPVEDGDTFAQNAYIKAAAALDNTGLAMAVADDSGLCVDALDGAPGIFSARWAGEHGNDAANNQKLMRLMEGVPRERRTARFHSSVGGRRGRHARRGRLRGLCGHGAARRRRLWLRPAVLAQRHPGQDHGRAFRGREERDQPSLPRPPGPRASTVASWL